VLNSFKTEEEIIKTANDSNYGLMAGVFTQDISRVLRVASEFDPGMVGINCVSLNFKNVPFGGTKKSGLGRENGSAALKSFTEQKTLIINFTY
jgi:aldehyde dehydrogenase (NAD+)